MGANWMIALFLTTTISSLVAFIFSIRTLNKINSVPDWDGKDKVKRKAKNNIYLSATVLLASVIALGVSVYRRLRRLRKPEKVFTCEDAENAARFWKQQKQMAEGELEEAKKELEDARKAFEAASGEHRDKISETQQLRTAVSQAENLFKARCEGANGVPVCDENGCYMTPKPQAPQASRPFVMAAQAEPRRVSFAQAEPRRAPPAPSRPLVETAQPGTGVPPLRSGRKRKKQQRIKI